MEEGDTIVTIGIIRDKYKLITIKNVFQTLLLQDSDKDFEIDHNNMIRNIFFNDTYIHYTWYTTYDKYFESTIVKIDDIINDVDVKHYGFFSDRGFPEWFYTTGIENGEYDLPYTINMVKNIILYNKKEYHFEDLHKGAKKQIVIKNAYDKH